MTIHILTTCKPFVGRNGEMQRAAFASWAKFCRRKVGDDSVPTMPCPVTVLGDEYYDAFANRREPHPCVNSNLGADTAIEVGLGYAAPLWPSVVKAGDDATSPKDILVWLNADIILTRPIDAILEAAFREFPEAFVAARRYNVAHEAEASPTAGVLEAPTGADVFAWRRGWFTRHGIGVKPMIVGRMAWDSYLMGLAVAHGEPALDLTVPLHVCHPQHDYGHLTGAEAGIAPVSNNDPAWLKVAGRNWNYKVSHPSEWQDMRHDAWVRGE
jgi:hypothetical protein